MAIAFGNLTTSNQNPGGSSQTLSVNCSAGTDRALFVVITMANSTNFNNATYNGIAMTLVNNQNYSGFAQRQACFYLANPDTGANNLVINFTGSQWSSTSIMAQSLTGASQTAPTNYASNGGSVTPHTESITISANDVIYLSGISNGGQSFNYDIAGSSRTPAFNGHNTNKIVEGAWSSTSLSAGSKDCVTKADSGNITNHRWALSEASVATPTITLSESSLTGFDYVEGSGPSGEQTFTVSGDDLTASATVTAPTNYEVSETSGSGYASSIVLTQTGGNIDGEPVTIYVRLKAGLSPATYNEQIDVTSTGATTQSISVGGTVTAAPVSGTQGSWWYFLK